MSAFDADDQALIGRVLAGRYQLEALLGTGAMGAVYRAQDRERATQVAIKVLRRFLSASKEAEARFRREAQVGARLAHRNCVAVIDSGTSDDGSFFLVMELLEGESLGDLLDRERVLTWWRALRITRHVLRGLEHAHRQSIIHRDIKPDNVFLVDGDFARILDFGIAKMIGDAAQNALTQAGITIGTPKYLSPEQAVGGALDGRTDLYSTSILLFEMLTGRTPFEDREPLKTLMAHATAPVPRFAEVAPDLEIPPEIETLVRDGLAKDPADRIPSATAYLARIDDLIGPEHQPIRRRGRRLALAGLALAAAGAIGVGAYWLRDRASSPTTRATPAAVDAAIAALDQGKTCADRLNAVEQLRALGDPRAIPALQNARVRSRRGKNENACLQSEADATIAELSARRR